MSNQFFTWDDFVDGFGREMRIASEVYDQMVSHGLKPGALCQFDFNFISDRKENLEGLGKFLQEHYPYTVIEIKPYEDQWDLRGMTDDLSITADTLMYWVLDMLKRGYEFDAEFDAYGAPTGADAQRFPDLKSFKEDEWFDHALKQYQSGNLSGALIGWSHVITINPANVDAFYSRAIVKHELHTWKAALRDYDAALEIAPDFLCALVNRGSLQGDNGNHEAAIADYDAVIRMAEAGDENLPMAHFNRGNSRMALDDANGAHEDWQKALDLGMEEAAERIRENRRQ